MLGYKRRLMSELTHIRHYALGTRAGLLAAILWCAWAASRLTWQLFAPAPAVAPAEATASVVAPGVTLPAAAARIRQAQLFGPPPSTTSAVPPPEVPVSHLDLRLHGVLVTETGRGFAMIGRGKEPAKLYGVGTKLPGGAELLAVYNDHVLINVGGERQKLLLRPDDPQLAAAARAPRDGAYSDSTAGHLGEFRARMLAQPRRLLEMVSAQPVMRNGKFHGFSLVPTAQSRALFSEVGLRNGDVITAVNGIVLDRPSQGVRALSMLRNARDVELHVDRHGRRLRINHHIE